MATFYLDPVGGNDANDGTTFANRWQTFTSGATAARTAPGDTIRIIASPDATALGQAATFTDGSPTVTLTTAVTQDVNQAVGSWTASTNVTSTTSTNRKFGSFSTSIAIAAGFTTGKAAYTSVAINNFSAYQQLSFWINMTAGVMTVDGDISICLCSDTLGATVVNTFPVPRIRGTGTWQAYTVDFGSALGSSIQSIALYVNVDRAAQTFLLNNIMACKAPSAADSLSLTSLIGKNNGIEPWLGIQSILGTAITLESHHNYSLATNTPNGNYSGTTESTSIYKREPLILPSSIVSTSTNTTTWATIQEGGSAGSPVTYSGGWNRTDMSTQTGLTYVSGVNGWGYGLQNQVAYVNVSKYNPVRFYYGVSYASATNSSFDASDVSLCYAGLWGPGSGSTACNNLFTITNACQCQNAGIDFTTTASNGRGSTLSVYNASSNYGHGVYLQTGVKWNISITNANRNGFGTTNAGVTIVGNNTNANSVTITNLKGNNGYALRLENSAFNKIYLTGTIQAHTVTSTYYAIYVSNPIDTILDCTGASISCSLANQYNFYLIGLAAGLIVKNGTWTANAAGTANFYITSPCSITIDNPTIALGNGYLNSGQTHVSVKYSRPNGANGSSFSEHPNGGSIYADATTRHTASGYSWKIMPSGYAALIGDSTGPTQLPLGPIAVNANTLVTASVWVYKAATSSGYGTITFTCPGGQIAGVPNTVTATAVGASNTWEQLTITFTPTAAGVVQLYVNSNTNLLGSYNAYVDDFSVSQA